MENEVVKIEGTTPYSLLKLAIEKGSGMDQIEKFMDLQERYEANEARKAFARDFSSVQSEVESVFKSKENKQTNSNYADLSDVIDSVKPIYSKYGFSIIFSEGETPNPENIRILADVLHVSGHQNNYYYDIPLDGVGIKGNPNMTKIHGKASSTSYARRYLLCMIWNIPTSDDTDGNLPETDDETRKTGQTSTEPKKALPVANEAVSEPATKLFNLDIGADKVISIGKHKGKLFKDLSNVYLIYLLDKVTNPDGIVSMLKPRLAKQWAEEVVRLKMTADDIMFVCGKYSEGHDNFSEMTIHEQCEAVEFLKKETPHA